MPTLLDVYPDLLDKGWVIAVFSPEVCDAITAQGRSVEFTIDLLRSELRRQARADRIKIQTVASGSDFDPQSVVAVRRNWKPTPPVRAMIWGQTGYHACTQPINDAILMRPARPWRYCPRCAHTFDWNAWRVIPEGD